MAVMQRTIPMVTPGTRLVKGACPHDCPDTCATITEVRDGRAVRFYAEKDHPITQGWLCAKVRPYLDFVYHPDRLQRPLRRVGPKGSPDRWEPLSWEDAIGEIASRWQEIIARYGAAAILPYSYSGQTGIVQLGVCNQRLWNRMGASGLQRSICGAAASAAVTYTYGARLGLEYTDVLESRLVVLWGHNPASTAPHFMPQLREAQRRGAYIVVIDPRRTLTARSADVHLQPRPATDGALALGLLHVLFAEGLHDEPWLEAHSIGWRDLRDRVASYSPERVAEITGIPAETIVALARRFGTTKPTLLKVADGVQRHGNGGQTIRAIISLPAVVGQVGVRGGGLSYYTADYISYDAETLAHKSECPPQPRVVNMNRLGAALTGEVSDPPIMSLYVFSANPVVSTPNTGRIVQGMLRDDLFTVVHELFMTDTASYADIVLPATSQLEQIDLHEAYGHRFLQYNAAAIPPLGEAKSNWDVMRLLAEAMGYQEPWLRQSAEEVIAELLETSSAITPALAGITLERLQAEGTVAHIPPEHHVPFADGRFPTPSGKLELRCDALAAIGLDPLPDYQAPSEFAHRPVDDPRLTLITGAAHHFVSSSFANMPHLLAKEGEIPWIEIHPEDARRRSITDGALVEVANARGACRLRAVVTENVLPGVVVAPKGRWLSRSLDGHNVNWTTSDALAELAGQSTFHSNLVEIRPAE
ncbi:MAG TPA: molybdopterin oxidoreductase family protein [Ktedonobacterales bacterium]|nr:molybdopterin oxidoreductase family protein [Ktedonobacterales bacterium]